MGQGIYFASENCKSAGYGELGWDSETLAAAGVACWPTLTMCFVFSENFQEHWRDVPVRGGPG